MTSHQKTTKTSLVTMLAAGFFRIVAWTPVGLAEKIVIGLYWILWPLLRKDRKLIAYHGQYVLGLPSHKLAIFAKKVICSQVLVYWDTLRYLYYPERLTIEGVDEFDQAFSEIRENPSGHVVITAHLGAWELAGKFSGLAAKRPFLVLAKPSKVEWVNPILDVLRSRLGMKVLWTDSKSLFRDMLRSLAQGYGLGFVMDQRPGKQGGHLVTFLGVANTSIVTGPAAVLKKIPIPVIGAYCVRVGPSRYRLFANQVILRGTKFEDSQEISQLLAQDMETMIRQFPEQWAWNYKRWKGRDLSKEVDTVVEAAI